MKKKHLCAAWRILAGVAILASMVSVRAQVSNPSAWFDFVSGSGNPLVTDTFRTQTLQQLSTDNWEYETKGGALLPAGAKTLRIPLGGIISFTPFSAEGYKNVKIKFRYAGDKLIEEEDLSIRYTSLGKMKDRTLYSPVVKDGKTDAGFNYRVCLIEDSPSSLEIYTNDPAPNSQGGFYLVNSFTAYGDIPRYSLFSGSGNWNDTVRWSHLPPLHERGALINGAVTIDTSVECQTASLTNDSRLNITQNAHFIVDTLSLYNADISLTADGELTVNKQVTIYYTFPSKGKWHFVSFPFNVRPKGLDERFQWKDDSFSGKGNYLYVQIYDGGKRAINNKVTSNWTVLSPNTFSGDFLFEKGKGYLIALDAAASDNTLAFSVDASNLPDDFGKTTSIPVSATSATDEANSGWYLCGNPLPAPLSLSQIASDPLLDGNIYLYEESKYKAYPIGSNIILPPFLRFLCQGKGRPESSSDSRCRISQRNPPENRLCFTNYRSRTGKTFRQQLFMAE